MSDDLVLRYAASQRQPAQGTGRGRTISAPLGCFDALRRCCRRARCVRACRRLGSVAAERVRRPAFSGQLASVSYTPFDGSAHPDSGTRTTRAQIRADLKTIAPHHAHGPHLFLDRRRRAGARRSPTSSACGSRSAPGSTRTPSATSAKSRAVIDLSRKHRNIDSIVVGNETIYRGEQKVEDLIKLIQRVKRETSVPVTTGEIWHVWIEHPELASAVDFIAAHILPYWEGISETAAVDQAIRIYDKLRQAYPGKRIVIAEFGWPSAGYNRRDANPGPLAQARGAARLRQPRRGARHRLQHHRSLRPAVEDLRRRRRPVLGHVRRRARSRSSPGPARSPIRITGSSPGIAVLIGVLLSLPILALAGATVGQAALLAAAAHAVGAWFAIVFAYWNGHYFVPGAAFAFGARAGAAGAAHPDRARAHRGDRRGRVRPQAAPPDRRRRRSRRSCRSRRRCRSTSRPIASRRRC